MARIAMVTHSFYPRDPRVRRQALALLEAGHEVDVVCLRHPEDPPTSFEERHRVYRIPLQHQRHSARRYLAEYAVSIGCAFGVLSALHLERGYDLVQAHTPPDAMVFAAAAARALGARVLLDVHDPMPEAMMTKFGIGRESLLWRLVSAQEQLSARFADHVLTVTDQVADALVRRGVDRRKLSVVMNLSDPRVFTRE